MKHVETRVLISYKLKRGYVGLVNFDLDRPIETDIWNAHNFGSNNAAREFIGADGDEMFPVKVEFTANVIPADRL